MSTNSLSARSFDLRAPAKRREAGATESFLRGIAASLAAVVADRRMRRELAELDAHLLRDIGIAPDEMPRVYARDVFIPRAWRE